MPQMLMRRAEAIVQRTDDPFIQVSDYELRLPGVEGRHILLQISDTHICAVDSESSPDERQYAEERENAWAHVKIEFAKAFKEAYERSVGISTRECFSRLISYARNQAPELLLISGDALENMHPAGERFLISELSGLPFPYLCTPGNHEAEELDGIWKSGIQLYEGSGFCVAAVDDRLKTVSNDSLNALHALCRGGIPVILVTHIPVMTAYQRERGSMDRFDGYYVIREDSYDANAAEFCRMIREEKSISMLLCGHIHGHHVSEAAPGVLQICCSQGMIGAVNRITIIGE